MQLTLMNRRYTRKTSILCLNGEPFAIWSEQSRIFIAKFVHKFSFAVDCSFGAWVFVQHWESVRDVGGDKSSWIKNHAAIRIRFDSFQNRILSQH